MGEEYVWIDAICIKQTDKGHTGDWETEASKVGDYYANAECLISAASARESEEGFLGERLAWRYPQRRSVICHGLSTCKSERVFLIFQVQRMLGFTWGRLSGEPLATRGWCLQEWLLCPRRLHFTRNGLYWECNSSFASEWEVLSGHNQHAWNGRDEKLKMCTILQQGKKDALGESWLALVEDFSGRNLTVESDRLVAIQGIASRLARQHGETYCAGVFGSNLAHGLLWERSLGSYRQSHDFPSWSWASVSGKVEWPSFLHGSLDTDCLAELVRFPCHGPVFDFAGMSSRELLIEAPLLKVFLKYDFTKTDVHQYVDVNRTEIQGPNKWEEKNLPIEVFIILNLADKDTIVRSDAGLVAAIISQHERTFWGILLKPVCINGKEAYMRQGTFFTEMVLELHDETTNMSFMKSEITLV